MPSNLKPATIKEDTERDKRFWTDVPRHLEIWKNMSLKNKSYVIYIGTKNFTEKYFKDEKGWLKVSARGRELRMTAEQVLNHL